MEDMTLWYQTPAKGFKEALPLGNGRLGAMVYGAVDTEFIKLNEDSLWYGGPVDRINPDCLPNLEKIRRLIAEGKIKEAEQTAVYAMSGVPQSQRAYLPLGSLYMKFTYDPENPLLSLHLWKNATVSTTPVKEYRRSLDLERAVAQVSYTVGNTLYSRTHFISYPDQVLVLRLTANGENRLNFSCFLDRFRNLDRSWKQQENTVAFDGNTGKEGISFCGMLRGITRDGICQVMGEHLVIREASEVILLFTAATSFRSEHVAESCLSVLDQAEAMGYEKLLQHHIKDYTPLSGRMHLTLKPGPGREPGKTGEDPATLPTDRRLQKVQEGGEDIGLMQLYFHYGRYLLIASSRPGTLPANLQGIWNDAYHMALADSKFTININTQMNYWAAETANLPECHMPLFDLLKRLHKNGRETARRMYGCEGFVAHHNTDLYADAAPQDQCITATYWVMGGAWLSLHIWMHYEYTGDTAFFKEHFYLIRDAVLFFNDFLTENKDGYLVAVPTLSPENTYILPDGREGCLCAGCAMDNQILTELYRVYLNGCELLGASKEEISKARKVLAKICPPQVGAHGQIMEWMEDYEEKEPGHRHISQLFGVYPGESITLEDTPLLMEAARTTLLRRLKFGGGHTGWSRAWIINLWARFREGEQVYENCLALLRSSTFPNLMDNHPYPNEDGAAFQIDGNLGALAGILQCFVQEYRGRVILLPALPEAFGNGSLCGVRIKGNAVLDLEWEDGRLMSFAVAADADFSAEFYYGEACRTITVPKGEMRKISL